MSWRALHWAKGQRTGSPSTKAVLLCLGEMCDQWGFVWAGGLAIADDAELSLRQVREHIRRLAVEKKMITIFQGRGRDGAIRNLYRLNFEPQAKDAMPEDHPNLSDRYQHCAGIEALSEAIDHLKNGAAEGKPSAKMSGGPSAESSGGPSAESDQTTGHTASSLVRPSSGEPIRTDKNHQTRAREGAAPEGAPSRDAADRDDEAETPVNAHWRATLPTLRRYFAADPLFAIRVEDCVPDSDDGEVLVLAVPTREAGNIMRDCYGTRIEDALDREVRFRVTKWAYARREQRKRRQGLAS